MTLLNKQERERWHHFKKQGSHNLARCKVNDFNWNSHNTLKHEVAKLVLLDELVRAGHKCITECVEMKTGLRRDIYDLTDGLAVEVETEITRASRHKEDKSVMVHMVGDVIEDLVEEWR